MAEVAKELTILAERVVADAHPALCAYRRGKDINHHVDEKASSSGKVRKAAAMKASSSSLSRRRPPSNPLPLLALKRVGDDWR